MDLALSEVSDDFFDGCSSLTNVVLPVGLNVLGQNVFHGCSSLDRVTFKSAPPKGLLSSEVLLYANSIVYPSSLSSEWGKVLENSGYRGKRFQSNEASGEISENERTIVSVTTNFICETVTNIVCTNVTVHHYTEVTNHVEVSESVTNYVHTFSVVTNVVTYVPEAGSSPLDVYPAKAGGDAAQVVAGAAGWDALDLPEGMTWDRETGALGGTPVRSGVYDVILVSGSGANTRMMRTTINVAGFDPVVGYVGTSFAWKGAPMTMLDSYKNLPAGLKWTASAGTLAGVPTKAGDYSRATTYGDAVPFTVEELPVTAVGTFNGLVSLGGTNYPLTVTTTKAGKLTAKIVLAAKTLSLTASSWGGWSRGTDGHLLFSATLSTKTDSLDVVLDADAAWNADQLSAAVTAGTLAGASGSAQRNAFAADAKAAASEAAGTFTLDLEAVPGGYRLVAPEPGRIGSMTVALKATGAATLKGKVDAKTSVSSTATLHVGPDGARSLVFFYKGSQFTWTW